MTLFILGLLLILSGGLLALLRGLSPRMESILQVGMTVVGCMIALVPVFQVLIGGHISPIAIPWTIPGGQLSLSIDPLSALFLLLHFMVSGASVVFGLSYFHPYEGKRSLKSVHFFFSAFMTSIALVLTAHNGILFLVAWELMALSAFFLVIFDGSEVQVRKAGLLYLAATHAGTLCLFSVFVLLGTKAGSFDFEKISGNMEILPMASSVFILSVIGFGGKAGFMPLHIWLPEAHPAAPSPISALMSGVMIKMGIYGLIRILSFYHDIPSWWGYTLGSIGIVSGLLGIIWAIAQSDFKRLLAYSSIENIGIISMGLGLGYLGLSFENPVLSLFGFGGALLHVFNHGLFKSLLFLGAGSILHSTSMREMDRQGGLLKKMPLTGFLVLIGSVAICGLPPLNGFISEWLIYYGAFHLNHANNLTPLLGAPMLALIGALAVTCFTKAFGMQFLGTSRSWEAGHAHEPDLFMTGAMAFLGMGCCLLGFFPELVLPAINRAVAVLVPAATTNVPNITLQPRFFLPVHWMAAAFSAALFILFLLQKILLSRRPVASASTWGCGYTSGSPRMQYTASSFTQFPVSFFQKLLRPVCKMSMPEGYFPEAKAGFASQTPDLVWDRFLLPMIRRGQEWFLMLRRLQHGRVQLYLVYMFLFLVALFIWKL